MGIQKGKNDEIITERGFYKSVKLSSWFSARDVPSGGVCTNSLSQFSCNESECNATYIGYTTNTPTANVASQVQTK